jgi:hypothetical protein
MRGASVSTKGLTERQQATLEHLKHAQELGSKLSDYARAFGVDLKDLYNGRTQLQRKGFWPKLRSTECAEPSAPELLAVQFAEPESSEDRADWMCRLRGPTGWTMECRGFPEVSWLAAFWAAIEKASA